MARPLQFDTVELPVFDERGFRVGVVIEEPEPVFVRSDRLGRERIPHFISGFAVVSQ